MVVQHNINAMTAYNKLNVNVTGLKKSSEKLASGYRINRAGDDAAGLAVSEKMRSQIKGLNQAVRNAQDGINMIQTFEGAATNTHEILQRMKVLAEESANGTYDNTTDRDALELEFKQLNDELNQIADTDFNGRVALNGGTMADGTVATNNTTVAGKPLVRTNYVSDPSSAETYQKLVSGSVDAAGNGSIIVNGTSIELKGGKGGATVGGTTYTVENFAKTDGGDFNEEGKITAKTVIKVNPDTTQVTIFGKTYNVKSEIVTDDDVTAWNEAKKAHMDQWEADYKGADKTTDKAAEETAWETANPEPTPPGTLTLIKDDGTELTADDLGVKTLTGDAESMTFTIEEEYMLQADGTVKDDEGNGARMGLLNFSKGVSVSNAFEHGRRNLTYSDSITLQTGARSKDAVDFTFSYTTSGIGDLNSDLDISSRGLGTSQLSVLTAEKANEAIDHIDNAINKVSMVRATFGSIQNRLEYKIDNITTTATNLQEAESNIRDTDMANEMMNYTKYSILQQAAQSMLAQANQQPQSILQLLG